MTEMAFDDRVHPSAVGQLHGLCARLKDALPSLEAVVLHGSAAMAGFEPGRSDLDVRGVVRGQPGNDELAATAQAFLTVSGNPHPLEVSVVSLGDLEDWRHPYTCLLHFGEEERERFASGSFAPRGATDPDLAMHLVVARARGIDLLGAFDLARLPEVPRVDFLAAVLSDFEWAAGHGGRLADYVLSNACRTLAYLREGVVLSKLEGRRWCADRGIDTGSVVATVVREVRRELA